MKTIKILSAVFLTLIILSVNGWCQEIGFDYDNAGKLIGQIIDPITRQPVNEKFYISIFTYNNEGRLLIYPIKINTGGYADDIDSSLQTDKMGNFSALFLKGIYNISIAPVNTISKYCEEPLFEKNREKYSEKYDFQINIDSGKITRIARKATLGGKAKILLVDPNGNLIDPRTDFWNNPSIKISMFSDVTFRSGKVEMEAGEHVVTNLFPETYKLNADIQGFGQTKIRMDNIAINAEETTIVKVELNPFDNTGVEGYVFDKNGVPVPRAGVAFAPVNPTDKLFIDIWTDSNGYFKLNGMPIGQYEVILSGENLRLGNPVFIEIKKDILLRLDLRSKFSKK